MSAGHENKADASFAERESLMDELLDAARQVVANWEKGDLAGAVRLMSGIITEIDEHDVEEEA